MPTPTVFAQFKLKQNNGNQIDLDNDTIKVMLVTSARTPVTATDEFMGVIDNTEVSGTNYTAGGATIATVSMALDTTTAEWTHADITWSLHASGFSNARYAVWYKDTGTPGTSPVIMWMDFSVDKGNVTNDLTLDVDQATGVLAVS